MSVVSNLTPVFSYGSNSTRQLRARVGNLLLESEGAVAPEHTRVFCLRSANWDDGGVASLAPRGADDTPAHGSLVHLTDDELRRLDDFEGGYRQERISVRVNNRLIRAVAYIALPGTPGMWTASLTHNPSEMYLTAVRIHLREHWDASTYNKIDVCTVTEDGKVKRIYTWEYPGLLSLGLQAFMEEVNFEKGEQAWVDGGPKRARNKLRCVEKLREVGIDSPRALRESLARRGELTRRLRARGLTTFRQNTLDAMRNVLNVHCT